MKRIIVLMAVATLLGLTPKAFAQKAMEKSIENFRANCIVEPTAEFFMQRASSEISDIIFGVSEFGMNQKEFETDMLEIYRNRHTVPLADVPNNLWLLVSKQLKGQQGTLTLTGQNYIVTRDSKNTPRIAIATWNAQKSKWVLSGADVTEVTFIKKGSIEMCM